MHAGFRFMLGRLLIILGAISSVQAFYIPGWSIRSYVENEAIPLQVNKVYSDNTQLQYAYYDLPFVFPPTGQKHAGYSSGRRVSLNLGEVLRGDRIMASDYDLAMGQDNECQFLGNHPTNRKGIQRAQELIENGYVAEWIVDNLPGATSFVTADKTHKYYAAGFKVGYKDLSPVNGRPRYFINNHHTFVIRWRKAPGRAGNHGGRVIVGFEIYTKSIENDHRDRNGCPQDLRAEVDGMEMYIEHNNTELSSNSPTSALPADNDDETIVTIPYTYSVYFREDEKIDWSKRWDLYFNNQEESTSIHWLAIVNSLVICGLLTAVVVMILARTVIGDGRRNSRDGSVEDGKVKIKIKPKGPRNGTRSPKEKSSGLLDQNNEADQDDESSSDEEFVEDITGWKLLHGDVFRAPPYARYLAPIIGSGTQLVFMATGLLLLSTFGILNPSFRGGFVSVGTGLFVFAGLLSGYFSSRIYKTFSGKDNWRRNTVLTALLFPGLLFLSMFILNLFVWAQQSSTALPFGTLIGLIALWLLIQLPLVYCGGWYGFHHSAPYEHPTKTNSIARQIPSQSWYTKNLYSILIAGLVPFAVVFIELLFIFQSIWQDKSGYYYVFGFLSVVAFLSIVAVVEVTVVATYVQLCAENYHWWWQSIFIGSGSAVWIFAYCSWFYFFRLHVQGFVSGVLFFGYSALACAVYGLMMGTVAFMTAYTFVRRIYGAIKAD